MIAGAPLYLADTSALARAARPGPAFDRLANLVERGLVASCTPVNLEIGYAARNAGELSALRAAREELYIPLSINEMVEARAEATQELLAKAGRHRVAAGTDLLIAAIAQHHNAIVLHYDADFDAVAEVTGQPAEWIVPRGTAD